MAYMDVGRRQCLEQIVETGCTVMNHVPYAKSRRFRRFLSTCVHAGTNSRRFKRCRERMEAQEKEYRLLWILKPL